MHCNSSTVSNCSDNGWAVEEVLLILVSLQNRGLIKSMEFNSFTRIHHEDTEIKVVKQMPTIASNKQPTIAIITAQYCEKLAVDSMLENKETFVRYTTVGKEGAGGLLNQRGGGLYYDWLAVYLLRTVHGMRLVHCDWTGLELMIVSLDVVRLLCNCMLCLMTITNRVHCLLLLCSTYLSTNQLHHMAC